MKTFRFVFLTIVCVIFFIYALLLGIYNAEIVNFNYFFAQTEIKISILLAIFFGIGFLFGWFFTFLLYLRERFRSKALQRKLNKSVVN